jgi:hypothetical protein
MYIYIYVYIYIHICIYIYIIYVRSRQIRETSGVENKKIRSPTASLFFSRTCVSNVISRRSHAAVRCVHRVDRQTETRKQTCKISHSAAMHKDRNNTYVYKDTSERETHIHTSV